MSRVAPVTPNRFYDHGPAHHRHPMLLSASIDSAPPRRTPWPAATAHPQPKTPPPRIITARVQTTEPRRRGEAPRASARGRDSCPKPDQRTRKQPEKLSIRVMRRPSTPARTQGQKFTDCHCTRGEVPPVRRGTSSPHSAAAIMNANMPMPVDSFTDLHTTTRPQQHCRPTQTRQGEQKPCNSIRSPQSAPQPRKDPQHNQRATTRD